MCFLVSDALKQTDRFTMAFAIRPARFPSLLARLCAVLLLGSLAAACNPDGELRVNSPATDAAERIDSAAADSPRTVTASFASTADSPGAEPAPVAVAMTRNARLDSPAPPNERFYVEFRSRSALSYGHTFAMFGRLNPNGTIATREVAGLHPATESPVPWMIGHVLPVVSETGPSDGDLEDQYTTSRYRITMDKARYDRMVAYIRRLQASSPMWHAVLYNCNAFVGDIARHMGITPPGNTMLFPKDYIDEMRALNQT